MGIASKLSPRFIGPFEILDRVGAMAYHLALPPRLANVHNVFHILLLQKYEPDPSHILDWGVKTHPTPAWLHASSGGVTPFFVVLFPLEFLFF